MDHFVILSEQVTDFDICFEPYRLNPPFSIDRQVMRVPWLHVVVNSILLLTVAFTDIDERLVETVVVSVLTLPIKTPHRTAAVPRDIRNLMTVEGIIGVRHIHRCLVRIIESSA